MVISRELPLLLNGVDIAFLVVGIIVIIFSAIAAYDDELKRSTPFKTSIVVFAITLLYIFIFRNKESTVCNPWGVFLLELILGGILSIFLDDCDETIIPGVAVVIIVYILGIHFAYWIDTDPVYVLEDNTIITAEEYNAKYNENVVTYLDEKVEEIPIYAFSTGDNVNGSMSISGGMYSIVGSGYINTERVYIYYYENEWGILVQDYVSADKLYSGFSRTLKEGEQPYLKKIHQYDITVDNNVTPEPRITEEYKRTLNIFYVPENAIVTEFSLD